MKGQKRYSSEQDKNCPQFSSKPFSLTIPQSLSLTLPWVSAFSSTAHCLRWTSSVKPPNPATTSSVELVLPGSIFPPKPQWNLHIWTPHSSCLTLTTAILSFLACLLPLSKAFVAYRTVLLASYWKKPVKLTTQHLCFNFFTGSQSNKEFSTR